MKLILILFLILNFKSLSSQILKSDSLSTIAYWKVGEIYSYKFEKNKTHQTESDFKEKIFTSYISFEIKEETIENYLIKYSIDSMIISGVDKDNPYSNLLISELNINHTYLIKTDLNGSFLEIVNWKEIREGLRNFIFKGSSLDELHEKEIREMESVFDELTGSKDRIENVLSKDFSALFSNYGYNFSVKDTINYKLSIQNPYGGKPFPQYGQIYFNSKNVTTKNTIELIDVCAIDEKAGTKAISDSFKKLMLDKKNFKKDIKEMKFNIEDKMIQEFDLSNGSIKEAIAERKITIIDMDGEDIRTEKRKWELIQVKNQR